MSKGTVAADLTNKKFGKLTVIERVNKKKNVAHWRCLCDCGNETVVIGRDLRSGHTKSCGCWRYEATRNNTYKNGMYYDGTNLTIIYSNYKRAASIRGLTFELNYADFRKITSMDCHYCGIKPSNFSKFKGQGHLRASAYNGIDRVDNSKGYVLENCVPCCKQCNFAKHSMSMNEWETWKNRFVKFQNERDSK